MRKQNYSLANYMKVGSVGDSLPTLLKNLPMVLEYRRGFNLRKKITRLQEVTRESEKTDVVMKFTGETGQVKLRLDVFLTAGKVTTITLMHFKDVDNTFRVKLERQTPLTAGSFHVLVCTDNLTGLSKHRLLHNLVANLDNVTIDREGRRSI